MDQHGLGCEGRWVRCRPLPRLPDGTNALFPVSRVFLDLATGIHAGVSIEWFKTEGEVLRDVDVAGPVRSIPLGVRVVRSVDLVRLSKVFTDEIPIFRHVGEYDVLGELLAVRIVFAHP